MKIVQCIVMTAGMLCMLTSVADAAEKEGYPVGPGLEFRVTTDLAFGGTLGTYANIPLAARTVPIHEDDGWLGRPGTSRVIPNAALTVPASSYGIGVSGAGQYAWKNGIIMRVGVETQAFSRSLRGPTKGTSENTYAVNQYGGTARGTGMSLLYYSVGAQFSRAPSPFAEIQFRTGQRSGILAGFARRQRAIYVQNGYDRNDALETYSCCYVLDRKGYGLPYAGMNIGLSRRTGVTFRVGYELQRTNVSVPSFLQKYVERPRFWDIAFGLYYTLSKTQ